MSVTCWERLLAPSRWFPPVSPSPQLQSSGAAGDEDFEWTDVTKAAVGLALAGAGTGAENGRGGGFVGSPETPRGRVLVVDAGWGDGAAWTDGR